MRSPIPCAQFIRSGVAVALGFLSQANQTEGAVITPKSQSRGVQISLSVSGTAQSTSDAAADFGVFNKTPNYVGSSLYDTYLVQAAQNSEIGAASFSATVNIIARLGDQLVQRGKAQSDFKVTFRIVQPMSYTLDGSLSWDQTTNTSVPLSSTVTRSGAAGVLYEAKWQNNGTTLININ